MQNKRKRTLALLLCVVMLFAAMPFGVLAENENDRPSSEANNFQWGYPTNDAAAGAGTLDVVFKHGGYYTANATVDAATLAEALVTNDARGYAYTEMFVVPAGTKIWWTDTTAPYAISTDAKPLSLVTVWSENSKSATVKAKHISGATIDAVHVSAITDYGVMTQSKEDDTATNVSNGVCYAFYNNTAGDLAVSLCYQGAAATPVFYSKGEPQLMGENEISLPYEQLWKDANTETPYGFTYGSRMLADGTEQSTGADGYVLTEAIAVKPGETIALFGDRALNPQSGQDSQIIEDNETLTFAVYSDSNASSGSLNLAASQKISDAKIKVGAIANTGVVVYEYTNSSLTDTVYVRVSYVPAWQLTSDAEGVELSKIYRYAPLSSYYPVRQSNGVAAAYYTNQDASLNTVVKTPAEPPRVENGVFLGWQVLSTQNNSAKKEFYPPETKIDFIQHQGTVGKVADAITIKPIYLDETPFTNSGASFRTALPTGLQFKMYFRYSDFEAMLTEAGATGGALMVGAFVVPEQVMDVFLKNQNIKNSDNVSIEDTDALKNATLETASADAINQNFTMEYLDANQTVISNAAFNNNPNVALYSSGHVNTYYNVVNMEGNDYCSAFFTLLGSASGNLFYRDLVARAYLCIRYEITDNNGDVVSYAYSDKVYGEFKTSNVRSAEEVLLACLRDVNSTYTSQKYFADTKAEVEADVNGELYGDASREIVSISFYDPDYDDGNGGKGAVRTRYTRRFTPSSAYQIQNSVLRGTYYDPNEETRKQS